MLTGFFVNSVESIMEVQQYIYESRIVNPGLDFIILDEQSEAHADELYRFLHQFPNDPFKDTKLIHLYTPTTDSLPTDSLTGHSTFENSVPGVERMIKPPRTAKLLQMLVAAKNPAQQQTPSVGGSGPADEQQALGARTLYGNVLIAEGELCRADP